MPMRWTSENDQLLLIKFIETHDITVDTKKISEAWPATSDDNRPTPRAITERIHKIRSLAKAAAAKNGVSSTSTPATPASRKRGPKAGGSKSSTKRSRTGGSKKKGLKGEEESPGTPTPRNNGGPVKEEDTEGNLVFNGQLEDVFTQKPLGKRVRTAPAMPLGMISYNENHTDEDEIKYQSDVSEFAPANGDEEDDDEDMDDLVKDEVFI
ncbi:uncharacterized protein GIQ15_06791 [Arthroderma uncinatum]|uniref:uncharacterized protein n=1 Tax=Arthroderma uncinatum TaxID=74035 RepID=UPI00144A5F34|nr:uncharacterized protein GIQ15_06791 [Arthroderma uncinatum]KAF3479815.1 hypothetical protein GIQ15_06791 [Arthroderma uncinatum]